MSYTATDEFCGAGGSSSGLVKAGLEVKIALNHWNKAIETHAANHPTTDHRCVDVTKVDKRTWPRTHSHMVKDVAEPFPSVVGKPNLSLVVPYRAGARPHFAADQPISALATKEQHAVLTAPVTDAELADYHFRMIKWRESANAQRFPADYVFTGNVSENTMLAGNAVAANVAQWLGSIAIRTLDGAA